MEGFEIQELYRLCLQAVRSWDQSRETSPAVTHFARGRGCLPLINWSNCVAGRPSAGVWWIINALNWKFYVYRNEIYLCSYLAESKLNLHYKNQRISCINAFYCDSRVKHANNRWGLNETVSCVIASCTYSIHCALNVDPVSLFLLYITSFSYVTPNMISWLLGFCTMCKESLLTTFRDSGEYGTHRECQNVVSKLASRSVQKPKSQETIYLTVIA